MSNLPWLAPALTVWLVVAIAGARQAGRALGGHPLLGASLIISVGVILSATLTPLRGAIEGGIVGSGQCDLSRIAPASIQQLLRFDDVALNVALLVPLGVVLGLLPHSRLWLGLMFGAIALPFVVEGVQLLLTALGRACESGDVIDNLTGLALGLGAGSAYRVIRRR